MTLDPTKMKNWQIAEEAEKNIKPIFQLAGEMGLKEDELLPVGHTLGNTSMLQPSRRRLSARVKLPRPSASFRASPNAANAPLAPFARQAQAQPLISREAQPAGALPSAYR
jgi:hypothetical protein